MSGAASGMAGLTGPVEVLLRRLQKDGFSITAEDYARVRRVHVLKATWRRGELRSVLRACVVRSPECNPVFDEAFADAFGKGAEDDQVFPAVVKDPLLQLPPDQLPNPPPTDPPVNPEPKPGPSPPGPVLERSCGYLAYFQLSITVRRYRRWIQGALVLAVGGTLMVLLFKFGPDHLCKSELIGSCIGDRVFDPGAFGLGFLAALLLTAVAAAVAHIWLRLTAEQVEARQDQAKPPPVAQATAVSGKQFRVGLVGGAALPKALDRRRGRRIAEMLAYVDAGPDMSRYDIPASARRRATCPQEAGLVHARRRMLPVVVFLCDTAGPGPRWNTLATDAIKLFHERGLAVEVVDVDGSFHRGQVAGTPLCTPAIRTLLADPEGALPRVVLVFTDGARMHAQDLAVLRQLRKASPVLWLDYHDRRLWDVRHAAVAAAGVGVWQATQEDLECGLRAIYAPGSRIPASQAWQEPEGRPSNLRRQVWHMLGDAADWAADCSLLQPMSLALADRIRRELHPHLGWHAFSRLLSLPGSSLAAEGLRFGTNVTAFLRQRFALRRSPEAQLYLTSLIEQAITAHQPAPGTYAEAACDWTRLQMLVFTQPDAALPEIARLRDTQLLDPAPLDDLLDRIRRGMPEHGPPPAVLHDEMLLAVAPISLAARKVLGYGASAAPAVIWQAGTILLRDELFQPLAAGEAAFAGAGEVFARILRMTGKPDAVFVTNITTGRIDEVAHEGPSSLLALAGAGRVDRVVAVHQRGGLLILAATPASPNISARSVSGFDLDTQPKFLLSVSSDGKWAALVAGDHILLRGLDEGSPVNEQAPSSGITSLSTAGPSSFIAGHADGRLTMFHIRASGAPVSKVLDGNIQPIDVVLPGPITALSVAELPAVAAGKEGLAAIVAASRQLHLVTIPSGTVKRTIHLGWDATLVEAFADGVTVAVSGPGRFDIIDTVLGLSAFASPADADQNPLPPSPMACPVSDEGRRFATVDTLGKQQRIEVRTLKKRIERSAPIVGLPPDKTAASVATASA